MENTINKAVRSLRIVSKLEEWINKCLLSLGQVPFRLYDKFVPVTVKSKVSSVCYNIRTRPKDYLINIFITIKNLPSTIKQNQGALIHIFHTCFEITKQTLHAIQHFDVDKLKNGRWRAYLGEKYSVQKAKVLQIYNNTSPKTLLLLAFVLTTGSLAIFQIYKTSVDLYKRNISSVIAPEPTFSIARRPAYHDRVKKSFYVTNILIPFGFEEAIVDKGAEGIRSLIVDIEVETSNRYLSIYLSTQEHVIKDYLNRKMQPVIATFPLTEEGKSVVRAKIVEELNRLIKETEVQGTILNVYIVNITAS